MSEAEQQPKNEIIEAKTSYHKSFADFFGNKGFNLEEVTKARKEEGNEGPSIDLREAWSSAGLDLDIGFPETLTTFINNELFPGGNFDSRWARSMIFEENQVLISSELDLDESLAKELGVSRNQSGIIVFEFGDEKPKIKASAYVIKRWGKVNERALEKSVDCPTSVLKDLSTLVQNLSNLDIDRDKATLMYSSGAFEARTN